MPKLIGVIGSRDRNSPEDFELLRSKFFYVYRDGDSIISGGCPTGGDKFAEDIANYDLYHYIERIYDGRKVKAPEPEVMFVHMPDWELLGRSAGFVRNTYIARDCNILLALVSRTREGGVADTIKKTKDLGKEIIIL